MTMLTKYHRMGGILGMAAGPDSVAILSKNKMKKESFFFVKPSDC